MRLGSETMTRLSRHPEQATRLPRGAALARGSHAPQLMAAALACFVALGVSGCLLSPPAEYEGDERTPPVLDLAGAVPPLSVIYETSPGVTIRFQVRVRSNDMSLAKGSSQLTWKAFTHYQEQGKQDLFKVGYFDASTFDDRSREIKFDWPVDEPDGCVPVTVEVTHLDNLENVDGESVIMDWTDVATATWWINVEGDDVPNLLSDCPSQGMQ